MTAGALLAIVFLALAQAAGSGTAKSELDAVRQLYATAEYEDALKRLSALDGRHDPNQLDQYRALCLIGLGRVADAEQTLEGLVLRSPEFQVPKNEVSPAFLARFASVRKRTLPVAAKKAYTKAKASYDVKDYASAATELEDLLTLLRAESPAGDPALADLQQVAEGFLRLTNAELAVANRMVYTALDFSVTPPVELERKVPAWNPPAEQSWRWFRGVVQVVVDERGSVESVQLVESLADFYDAGLLEAARYWRFKPAERAGQPVKYRKLVEITMRPQ
jgi:TonB family protein